MYRSSRFVIAVALAALVAMPVLGQQKERPRRGNRMRGGFPGFRLLGQKSVQEDLRLSEDQVKQIKELQTKFRKERAGLRNLDEKERREKAQALRKESQKASSKILDVKQSKRLKQIAMQFRLRFGASQLLNNPKIAKKLELTDDQKKELKTIQEDTAKARKEIRAGEGSREEKFKKFREVQQNASAKAQKVLTDTQKAKWKDMVGDEFKGKLEFGRRGGRRGRGR